MEIKRLHAVIFGKVHGVGFRYYLMKQAINLNLVGWTRNRLDRTVEVLVEGKTKDLEIFNSLLSEGPPSSNVIKVKSTWEEPSANFDNFRIRRTI